MAAIICHQDCSRVTVSRGLNCKRKLWSLECASLSWKEERECGVFNPWIAMQRGVKYSNAWMKNILEESSKTGLY